MGETSGDLISQTLNLGYGGGTIALITLLIISTIISVYSKKQEPILYWTVITLASTTGTTISDYISRTLFHETFGYTENQGYLFSTISLTIALTITFAVWKIYSKSNTVEGCLNKITEFLYWIAILTSSTLGTALGDLLAHNTPLGFEGATIFLLVLLLIVILLTLFTKLSKGICYWLAIIITHPIGATMGDYMTKPEGFNLGNILASVCMVVVFIIIVFVGKIIKTEN